MNKLDVAALYVPLEEEIAVIAEAPPAEIPVSTPVISVQFNVVAVDADVFLKRAVAPT